MAEYAYNDIRNTDWYNRLIRGVREGTSASIRRTGSDVNDPYWRAREAEELGDLSNARNDAFRRAFAAARERQAVIGASMREREAGRQRVISEALRRQYKPSVGLGTMADDSAGAPAGLGAAAPAPISSSLPEAPEAPEAYPRPPAPTTYARDRSAAPAGVYTGRSWAAMQAAAGGYQPNKPRPSSSVVAGYNPDVFKNQALEKQQDYLDKLIQQTAESLYSQRPRAMYTPGYLSGSPRDFYAQAAKMVLGR